MHSKNVQIQRRAFKPRHRHYVKIAASFSALASFAISANAEDERTQKISIESTSLSTAIVELSNETGVPIFAASELTDGIVIQPFDAELTVERALENMLSSTSLFATRQQDGSVIVRKSVPQKQEKPQTEQQPPKQTNRSSQEISPEAPRQLDAVVVTGVRGRERTMLNSPSPIDVFSTADIQAVSYTDTADILQTLIPSFNIGREPSSDGATFIRPMELRGLPAHHTLVLVNGKRRHRSALLGDRDAGVHGPDVATIPSIAIQSIEVLRDGASALYGSDAIAGVINFQLKSDPQDRVASVEFGGFTEGDGDNLTLETNIGLPLGSDGFVSISAEYNDSEATERSAPFCRAGRFCLDPSDERFLTTNAVARGYVTGTPNAATAYERALQVNFPQSVPLATGVDSKNVVPWGQPNSQSLRFFVNAGLQLSDQAELYGFGNYSSSEADGTFLYRFPGIAETRLIREADGSLWSAVEDFPGGFTPRFFGEVIDWSSLLGVRGDIGESFTWDVSARLGFSEIDYTLTNTYNPSLGPDSPTSFKPGTLVNDETQVQADFTYSFDAFNVEDVVLAFGTSFMNEGYEIKEGDAASFAVGQYINKDPHGLCAGITPTLNLPASDLLNCANRNDPVYNVLQSVGSNGFPGYTDLFAGAYTRDSWALYGEMSGDLTERLFVQVAARYEDYSDFGSETVGKAAALYRLTDGLALRGSVGTGFRAPTPGQQGTTKVSTGLPFGEPVAIGLFPASSPVGQALGAEPLAAESSITRTVGVTGQVGKLSFTADYYDIQIDNAFGQISELPVSSDPADGAAFQNFLALEAGGVAGAAGIGAAFFYQNVVEISSHGVDLVMSYPVEWRGGQSTDLQFAWSWNEVAIEDDPLGTLNFESRFDYENFDPNTRLYLTANHRFDDRLSILGRVSHFGDYANGNNNASQVQNYQGKAFFDLEATWKVRDNMTLSAGGRNIFDQYPDEVDYRATNDDTHSGRRYESQAVLPWQGSYYFARLIYDF